jgi:hypothetical protein
MPPLWSKYVTIVIWFLFALVFSFYGLVILLNNGKKQEETGVKLPPTWVGIVIYFIVSIGTVSF